MPRPDQLSALRAAIGGFVDDHVRAPATQLVDLNFSAQDDVANVLVMVRLLSKIAKSVPDAAFAKYLHSLTASTSAEGNKIEALLSESFAGREHTEELRSIYCSYVVNLSNSACLSILGSSYLPAFIVTRSLLELLVGVGASTSGTMSEKIKRLSMLNDEEQKTVADFWRQLSGWAHPHQRWVKRLLPTRTGDLPDYDHDLLRASLSSLAFCVDLAFAIMFAKFAVSREGVRQYCDSQNVDFRRFMFLRSRLGAM